MFTRGFTTNNYVEGLNFALKSMLVLRPNLRVDSMFNVIFESFTPKYIRRHLEKNVVSWDGNPYRKKRFPAELGKRPVGVLEGLAARIEKAKKIPATHIDDTNAAKGVYRFRKNVAVLKAEYMLHVAKMEAAQMEAQQADAEKPRVRKKPRVRTTEKVGGAAASTIGAAPSLPRPPPT